MTTAQNRKKAGPGLVSKIAIIATIILVIAGTLTIGYFLYTDRILFRPPVLYSKSARINFAYGDVSYRLPHREDWLKAPTGLILPQGSTLKTGVDSKADVLFSDSMVVRLAENSELLISLTNIKNKTLQIEKGSIYGLFKRQFEDQKIQIITPTTVANVRGTELGFEVIETEQPASENPPPEEKETQAPSLPAKLSPRNEVKQWLDIARISRNP